MRKGIKYINYEKNCKWVKFVYLRINNFKLILEIKFNFTLFLRNLLKTK